jgi:hypothetical protein
VAPGRRLDLSSTRTEPSLVIATLPTASMKPGDVRWIAAATTTSLDHAASDGGEILKIDFKTQPVPGASLDNLQERR